MNMDGIPLSLYCPYFSMVACHTSQRMANRSVSGPRWITLSLHYRRTRIVICAPGEWEKEALMFSCKSVPNPNLKSHAIPPSHVSKCTMSYKT